MEGQYKSVHPDADHRTSESDYSQFFQHAIIPCPKFFITTYMFVKRSSFTTKRNGENKTPFR